VGGRVTARGRGTLLGCALVSTGEEADAFLKVFREAAIQRDAAVPTRGNGPLERSTGEPPRDASDASDRPIRSERSERYPARQSWRAGAPRPRKVPHMAPGSRSCLGSTCSARPEIAMKWKSSTRGNQVSPRSPLQRRRLGCKYRKTSIQCLMGACLSRSADPDLRGRIRD